MAGDVAYIHRAIQDLCAKAPQVCDRIGHLASVTPSAKSQVAAFSRQRLSDSEADPPRASGDKRDAFHGYDA
jgi:hypothetical protein